MFTIWCVIDRFRYIGLIFIVFTCLPFIIGYVIIIIDRVAIIKDIINYFILTCNIWGIFMIWCEIDGFRIIGLIIIVFACLHFIVTYYMWDIFGGLMWNSSYEYWFHERYLAGPMFFVFDSTFFFYPFDFDGWTSYANQIPFLLSRTMYVAVMGCVLFKRTTCILIGKEVTCQI